MNELDDLRARVEHLETIETPLVGANTYYLHNDAADVATYEKLLGTPAGGAEDSDAITVAAADGEVVGGSYITYPTSGLGIQVLTGGVWYFNIYCKVDNASTGISQIVARVYKREADTTETELFSSVLPRITSTTTALYEGKVVVADTVLAVTDRLVVKLFAKTTSAANRTVTYYYEGTANYSHIHTPTAIASGGVVQQQFIPLTTPLSSTSWDGDSRSTTAATLIDLSAVFGVPAGVKAVLAKIVARDSVAIGTNNWFQIGPSATQTGFVTCWTIGGDLWFSQTAVCPCDANGDIYFQCNASGASTLEVVIVIEGYWL